MTKLTNLKGAAEVLPKQSEYLDPIRPSQYELGYDDCVQSLDKIGVVGRLKKGCLDRKLQLLSQQDCGDNSCMFGGRKKGGMRTNGGCRCHKKLVDEINADIFSLIELELAVEKE